MREIYGLSLIFIDSYVPALTPLLHGSDPVLQISENINPLRFTHARVLSKEG